VELNPPIQFAQATPTPSRIFFKTDTILSVLAFRPHSKGVGIAGLQKRRIFVFKRTDEIGGYRIRYHTAHALWGTLSYRHRFRACLQGERVTIVLVLPQQAG